MMEFTVGAKVKLKGTKEPIMVYKEDNEDGDAVCVFGSQADRRTQAFPKDELEKAYSDGAAFVV